MAFKKAERQQVKLKIAISGPSGSGKTYSALRLATGIGGKIAGVDTENGSMSLYSDDFSFDVDELKPPFSTDKYIAAIKDAEKLGYTTIVVDSISHAWAGEGGLLEQKETLDNRGGKQNRFANWGTITKKHEAFKSAILQSNINVICTMRSKQEYSQVEEGGKEKIKKLGSAPIQREGMEYEFTTVFDLSMDNLAEPSKDRTKLFKHGEFFQITEETGKQFMHWIATAKAPPWRPTKEMLLSLQKKMPLKKWVGADVTAYMKERWKKETSSTLTKEEFEELVLVVVSYDPPAAFEVLRRPPAMNQPRQEANGEFSQSEEPIFPETPPSEFDQLPMPELRQ